jgi:hypothetical protein
LVKWFGPEPFANACLEGTRVPIPLAQCDFCDEPFLDTDVGFEMEGPLGAYSTPIHQECMLRLVVGSVAHQMKMCSCYGGPGSDHVQGQSKREEARAAVRYHNQHVLGVKLD